jgi:hypothetical protein
MPSFKAITLLALASAAYSSPLGPLKDFFGKRDNECNPINMPDDVKITDCVSTKKKQSDGYVLDKNGHCSAEIPTNPGKQGCTAYCEQSLALKYGQEVPFDNSWCRSGETCSITKGMSVTTTQTWEINTSIGFKKRDGLAELEDIQYINPRNADIEARDGGEDADALKATFNLGASYSFSQSVTYTETVGKSQVMNATKCGYYTFVPYVLESCGVVTRAPEKPGDPIYSPTGAQIVPPNKCDKSSLSDNKDWCNRVPMSDSNGHALGEIVLVYADCNTHQVIGAEPKHPYDYPGVSTGYKGST